MKLCIHFKTEKKRFKVYGYNLVDGHYAIQVIKY